MPGDYRASQAPGVGWFPDTGYGFPCPSPDPTAVPGNSSVLLEKEPVIVPPVLVKSALTEQPVLREVWTQAYRVLSQATRVVFVGYSMPVTDIGTKTLFGETLLRQSSSPQIEVVDWTDPAADEAQQDRYRQSLRRNYRELFADLPDTCFRFDGARAWAKEFLARA